jgi:glycosidase
MKFLFTIYSIVLVFLVVSCKQNTTENTETSTSIESITIQNDIERVEPPNWWVGFKNPELQLLVQHPNISQAIPEISYPGVSINEVHKADSPNYLFIDLNISESAKAGQFNITFKFENGEDLVQTYELKKREKSAEDYVGFDSSDVIYLITPDRFANANPSNDIDTTLLEKTINRKNDYARHGGDIKGITKHLDYISDMGFTAIWSCPLLTNDMPRASYHGYAMTDFYEVDPRFGTLEEYKELADKAREKGVKLIMDQVANHCGVEHWWMKDLPFKDWVNQQEVFENHQKLKNSSHRRTVNQDLYASQNDKKEMNEGWFVAAMPDLNQRNPFMANYIIQNSIWWIETAGLGGIRQDTYPYPDKEFMSDWAGAIMTEYPNFNIVGEEWSYNPLLIAYWQDGHVNKDGYDSNLKSTMDFAMQSNIVQGLKEQESWGNGLVKIYDGLANDFAYATPKDILIFPDNHDMSRIFTQMGEDVVNTKMALSFQLVLPRTVQFYYGTEILMNDTANPGDHGLIRTDFPGGWDGDTTNAFTGEDLTDAQKDMQSYLKKLLNYRKTSNAIHEGKTLHFAPEQGVYVLFRILGDETVVHILNKNDKPIDLDLSRFEEAGLKGKTLKNIISHETFVWDDTLKLNEKGSYVLSTKMD